MRLGRPDRAARDLPRLLHLGHRSAAADGYYCLQGTEFDESDVSDLIIALPGHAIAPQAPPIAHEQG